MTDHAQVRAVAGVDVLLQQLLSPGWSIYGLPVLESKDKRSWANLDVFELC